ncbi:MAG TPA: DUF2723 domain-containing protein [Chlorobium sp.]|uniref:DUF2723 domain-containing protein n=1 Tax=Chlorobium phaeovibrioides (strain DSM 265 / 1930) TaxID=290318 RepID=A4SCV2_CHLPM|nr:DUF2723 domain-containing protein [Chlorobium sp.]
MTNRVLNRAIAAVLFLGAELLYLATMAPTFSFWDCGEFIATARTLGVPHPPGAPLFLLLGRMFSMLPLPVDIGARVNLISTLASAGTVMLTYLIIVRLIALYRTTPRNEWDGAEAISAFGGAAIGALALAFSDSFWFNAVETEVYALSSLFTATVVWLILRWHEEYPEQGHERWLLLSAYMIGLSIGVHLLSLLAVFAIALVYYFRRFEVNLKTFSVLVLGSSTLFFLIYTLIIKGLPALLQLASWGGLILFLAILVYGVYYTQKHRMAMLNTVLMSVMLIVIGYGSYGLIYVRAQASPPINENNPSTPDAFFSYLNREQYGDMPLWPRRWSPEPTHQYYYSRYNNDLDYFLSYQLERMYLRYFGWQFIGRSDQREGAGVDWSVLWGIPFLVGFGGAVAHFRRQWKMGLVVTALFILTGAALVVYLNQTEPQPRERDYSYAGSFFAFALWIGIGVESLCRQLAVWLKTPGKRERLLLSVLTVTVLGLLVNGRMLQANYRVHDRSGSFVSWDWGWNILQSCQRDAILFTNGDNDTFPLWYLQEVEGIRTDVRVVNLSLANTGWYLQQLKNTSPRGARPVLFSLTNEELEAITYVPIDSASVELPSSAAARELERESREHGFRLPSVPLESIPWKIKPGLIYGGQGYLRPQDIAVYDIVLNNFADRPIYFALTVDPDGMMGLDRYLRLDGLVSKVVPLKSADPMSFVDPVRLSSNLLQVYQYRNLADSEVFLEETSLRLASNYSPLLIRLALDLADEPMKSISVPKPSGGGSRTLKRGELALEVLDTATRLLPPGRFGLNAELAGSAVALYSRLGEKQGASIYIAYLEKLVSRTTPARNPRLFYAMARAYRAAGRMDEAGRVIDSLGAALHEPRLRQEFEKMKE